MALNVTIFSRNQATALNSISLFYNHIIKNELSLNLNFAKSKRQPKPKLPIVITQDEVMLLMSRLNKRYYVIAGLMYGSGLRSMKVMRFRVQDIDFDYRYVRA